MPVWDVPRGNGPNTLLRVTGFVCIRLTGFQVLGDDWLSALYRGDGSCP